VGILACALRIGRVKPLALVAGGYIEAIRSTPLLAQLYFLYFGLPTLGLRLSEEACGVLALIFNSGAYMAEIIRGGMNAIPPGQVEAGLASGLGYLQRLRHIILPQAMGLTIPPLLGQAIVLVKDSALFSLISVLELTRAGQVLTSERFMPVEGFFTTSALYLVLYYFLKSVSAWTQRRLIFREAK
jgi:polar amino acid transport system permease protein